VFLVLSITVGTAAWWYVRVLDARLAAGRSESKKSSLQGARGESSVLSSKSKKKGTSVKELWGVESIQSGVIVFSDGWYRTLLKIGPIDYHIMNENEQYSIESVLMSCAMGMGFPIQLFSTAELVDTKSCALAVRSFMESQQNPSETMLEYGLHTLRRGEGGHPANLDAFLYCAQRQEAVACEMKMMEWLFNMPGNLRSAYLNKKNYDDESAAPVFISVAQNLIAPTTDYEDHLIPSFVTEYRPARRRYDAFQIFKHTLACYNECQENLLGLKKLTLVNCVWELPCPERLSYFAKQRYQSYENIEHQEFAVFYRVSLPIRQMFAGIGVDFDICYYSMADFLSLIEKDATSIQYLKRYTLQTEN
jgi:hypothetical protein